MPDYGKRASVCEQVARNLRKQIDDHPGSGEAIRGLLRKADEATSRAQVLRLAVKAPAVDRYRKLAARAVEIDAEQTAALAEAERQEQIAGESRATVARIDSERAEASGIVAQAEDAYAADPGDNAKWSAVDVAQSKARRIELATRVERQQAERQAAQAAAAAEAARKRAAEAARNALHIRSRVHIAGLDEVEALANGLVETLKALTVLDMIYSKSTVEAQAADLESTKWQDVIVAAADMIGVPSSRFGIRKDAGGKWHLEIG